MAFRSDRQLELNVLTLNCWGLQLPSPFCRKRNERINAIADKLAEGQYQIVLLQEIWVQTDYLKLCEKVIRVLPYSHYFHSGVFGSGVCIFSKYPVLETFQHRYKLAGSPVKFYQGDWYAEKSIGLAQLLVDTLRVNVYITHMQADYKDPNEYRSCRIVQAFELSQFIKNTSHGCDAVIVGGDFNCEPCHIGYNLVLANGNLLDSWVDQQKALHMEESGSTSNTPDNSFTNLASSKKSSQGERIDYILFRNNSGCDMICEECKTVMKKIPEEDFNYSDHNGVAASFRIRKNPTAMAPERRISAVLELYCAAVLQIKDGIAACVKDRICYILISIICLIALIFLSSLDRIPYMDYLLGILKTVLLLAFVVCACLCLSSYNQESILTSVKKDMEVQIQNNIECCPSN